MICLACRGKKKKYKDADKVRATVKDDNIIREIRLTHLQERSYYADVVRIGGPTALQGSVYCMISMVLTRMVAAFGAGAVATQRVGGQIESVSWNTADGFAAALNAFIGQNFGVLTRMVAAFGAGAVATQRVGGQIESVSWNTADGFAAALNAFIGQNFGAGRMERVRKGYRAAFSTILVWGVGMTLIFVLFPMQISGLFFHERKDGASQKRIPRGFFDNPCMGCRNDAYFCAVSDADIGIVFP